MPAIRSTTLNTARLRCHCLTSGNHDAAPLVLLHGNLSAATFFEPLMTTLAPAFRCIAPDLRGFGDSEQLPIDARRGLGDLSDDLSALLATLNLGRVHLLGWSAGGGVAMDFTVKHPQQVASLSLVAPVSPFGFGGTTGHDGKPLFPDFAASGAGTVSADMVAQFRAGDRGSASPFSPRRLLRDYFVAGATRLPREDALVDAMLKVKIGENHYPGDFRPSVNFSGVSPGDWGIINALSPKHLNLGEFGRLKNGPPVLWLRGSADRVVSDRSDFDLASHLPAAAQIGAAQLAPQPMVSQTRAVLSRYQARGGQFQEIVFPAIGHSPFLEAPEPFTAALVNFIEKTGE